MHVEKLLNDFLQYRKQFLKVGIHLFLLFCVSSLKRNKDVRSLTFLNQAIEKSANGKILLRKTDNRHCFSPKLR